jgi:tetrapyrrole methylase family protein/MazG family protein
MSAGEEFSRLVDVMRRLRKGCPWDRSQTHATLRPYLLEETYEVLHALDDERYEDLCEELGDLLLQIVFHAELAEEQGRFDIEDVARAINEKLIRRHPHVFGDLKAETPADVLQRWESIKRSQENKPSSLHGIPAELPALVKAARTLSKVRQTGVDPLGERDVAGDARRWLDRLTAAAEEGDTAGVSTAAGMLALCAGDLAARVRVSSEDALRGAIRRLTDAFRSEEARIEAEGRSLADLTEEERTEFGARLLAACEEEE